MGGFSYLVEPREIETYTRPEDDFPVFFKENRGFDRFFFIFIYFLDRLFRLIFVPTSAFAHKKS